MRSGETCRATDGEVSTIRRSGEFASAAGKREECYLETVSELPVRKIAGGH